MMTRRVVESGRQGRTLAGAIGAVLTVLGPFQACAGTPDRKTEEKVAAQQLEDVDAGRFGRSIEIDNKWMPLTPGTRFTYEGTTIEDDGTAVPHRVVIHVTDLTKAIAGIRTAVTWDLDYSDGELVE